MKKFLLLAFVLIAASIPTFAAPICNTVTLDTLLAGGANAALGCQTSDKIFNNFTYSGSVAPSEVSVTFTSNGPIPQGASIQFISLAGSWSSMNVSFDTAVDTNTCAACRIVNALDQIFTSPTPNSTAGTFTQNGLPNVDVNGSAPSSLSGQKDFPNVLMVSTNFTQTAGVDLQRVSVSFSETSGIPEPATFAMLGGGLVALALFRRKRRA